MLPTAAGRPWHRVQVLVPPQLGGRGLRHGACGQGLYPPPRLAIGWPEHGRMRWLVAVEADPEVRSLQRVAVSRGNGASSCERAVRRPEAGPRLPETSH